MSAGARLGSSERAEAGSALKARRACCCARPPRWAAGQDRDRPASARAPRSLARFLRGPRAPARQASGPHPPRPRRPLRGFGRQPPPSSSAAPPSGRTRVGSAQADPGPGASWGSGGRWPDERRGLAALQQELTPRAAAGPGPHRSTRSCLPRSTWRPWSVLPSRPASSARPSPRRSRRLRRAAPPRPAVRPAHWSAAGAGATSAPGSRRPGTARGRGLPGRTGGHATRPAPPASLSGWPLPGPLGPRLFHGNFGATGWAAGGAGTPRPPDGGVPLANRASARKGGVGTHAD